MINEPIVPVKGAPAQAVQAKPEMTFGGLGIAPAILDTISKES